jgi:hypothetical protein
MADFLRPPSAGARKCTLDMCRTLLLHSLLLTVIYADKYLTSR